MNVPSNRSIAIVAMILSIGTVEASYWVSPLWDLGCIVASVMLTGLALAAFFASFGPSRG